MGIHEDLKPLAQCEALHTTLKEELDKHVEESKPVRLEVKQHSDDIKHLEKWQETTMKEIGEIKDTLNTIDKKVDSKFSELKIWILSAAIAGLIVLLGEAVYFGGYLKQVDINTDRLNDLERLHPRMDATK